MFYRLFEKVDKITFDCGKLENVYLNLPLQKYSSNLITEKWQILKRIISVLN